MAFSLKSALIFGGKGEATSPLHAATSFAFGQSCDERSATSCRIDTPKRRSVQNKRKSTKDAGLFESIVGTVLGDGTQSLARKLHANVTTFTAVKLGHPNTLLLKVRINRTVNSLGNVTTDTTLLLSETGAMNAAAFMRHGERDIANSGHNRIAVKD